MNHRPLLIGGVAVPFVYFASQAAAILLNPGYNLASQQPSELGCCNANLTAVANVGFMATGVAAILGGLGLFIGLRRVGGNVLLAAMAGVGLVLFGVAMTMSGLFPLPSPLHYGFGFMLAGILAPAFGVLAFKDGGASRWIVFAGFVASLVIVALSLGLGGIVSEANVGLFARALALIAFPTIAYLCWSVMQRTKPAA